MSQNKRGLFAYSYNFEQDNSLFVNSPLEDEISEEYHEALSRDKFPFRTEDVENVDFQTLSRKLSWSHISELLMLDDELERQFYEKACISER